MVAPQNVIAVIFDFDDTLTDETTTKLLETHGIDPVEFWQRQNRELVEQEGWDPILAYLKLLLDHVGEGRPLGRLTNKKLKEFGSQLSFYSGVKGLFADLRRIAAQHTISNPTVEFYVITSGLEEIVRGSKISHELTEIWGCQFAEERGIIRHVKNVVSFTEKTRFLFEINKGIRDSRKSPYSVNKEVKPEDRRVPFSNMIYVGDGLTDVPCFSLLQRNGGKGFGVFDPKKEGSPKKGWETLVAPKRVHTLNSPRYGRKDDLGALIRTAVNEICTDLDLRTRTALS